MRVKLYVILVLSGLGSHQTVVKKLLHSHNEVLIQSLDFSFEAERLFSLVYKLSYFTGCPRAKCFFFNLALTERNVHVKFDLTSSVYSLGSDI